jgi:hypothetical protein
MKMTKSFLMDRQTCADLEELIGYFFREKYYRDN